MTKEELTEYITENFKGELEVVETDQPEPYFIVKPGDLKTFSRLIHDDPSLLMTFLMNLAAVHTGERFEMVYNVCSYRHKHRLFFKIILDGANPECESVRKIWPAADWYEREAWELFGINVLNHPNLTRFLLVDDWDEGFPMRKGWTGEDFIPMPEKN